jgi:hypothetical protein
MAEVVVTTGIEAMIELAIMTEEAIMTGMMNDIRKEH